MAQLQTSGAISLNEIHQNIGGTSGTTVSLNDTDVKELIFRDSYQNNSMNEYYGAFWHKNTITLNCGLCSYTKTYAPGTIYQSNYTRSMQGWSDVQPIVDTQVTYGTGACSSSTRGIMAGGEAPSRVNTITFITLATLGNPQDFGDLTAVRNDHDAVSSSTRGFIVAGANPSKTNSIEFVTIASTGNGQEFGDLTQARSQPLAFSDVHGGLGD